MNNLSAPPAGHYNIKGTILSESPKAIKFEVCSINGAPLDEPITEWFPLSQTKSIFRESEVLGEDVLTITKWIAETKNLV